MKKMYQVFYIIKKDRKEELNHKFVFANNSKEAITQCKKVVFEETKKHAFRATVKPPYEITKVNGKKELTI